MAAAPPDVERSTELGEVVIRPPIDLGGASPFTFELWIMLVAAGAPKELMRIAGDSEGLLTLSVETGPGRPAFVAKVDGRELRGPFGNFWQWTHVALSYDGTLVRFLVDGGEYAVVEGPLPLVASPAITLGPGADRNGRLWISDFAVWSKARTAVEIVGDMWSTSEQNGLVFDGDFTQDPPVDLAGATITVVDASPVAATPNLCNLGQGYAIPGVASDFNPCGAQPFSLAAWVSFRTNPQDADINGCLYSNGDAADAASWALTCRSGALVAAFGNDGRNAVETPSALAPRVWYHVAVTFDGATCSIYLDGALAAAGAIAPTAKTETGRSVLLAQSVGGAVANHLRAHVQCLSVWDACLTPEEVKDAQFDDASDDPRCAGNLICSINPPRDLVAAVTADAAEHGSLQLLRPADIGFDAVGSDDPVFVPPFRPDSIVAARIQSRGPAILSFVGEQERPPAVEALRRARPARPPLIYPGLADPGAHALVEPFSPAHAERMRRDLPLALAGVSDPIVRDRVAQEFAQAVEQTFAHMRGGSGAGMEPLYSYQRRGSDWVVIAQEPHGRVVVASYDAAVTKECAVWWLTFVATLISGLLAIFSIRVPRQDFVEMIQEYVEAREFLVAMNAVVAGGSPAATNGGGFTVSTLLQALQILHSFGLLSRAFWFAASSLGWWAAARFVAYLLLLVVPVPTPQKAMLVVNCVILVVQLVQQIAAYRQSCPGAYFEAAETMAPGRRVVRDA